MKLWVLVLLNCALPAAPEEPASSGEGVPGVASRHAEIEWRDLEPAAAGSAEFPRAAPRKRPRFDLPEGGSGGQEPEAAALEPVPEQALPPSPPPAQSFAALADNGTVIPPDTFGSAGPSHLVVSLNSGVRIQTRKGSALSTASLQGFWASLGKVQPFDPRVLYDPFHERWIFTSTGDPESPNSSLLIGVSRTADPTQGWFLNRVDVDSAGLVWLDHPTTGFNQKWVVVQGNLFNTSGGDFAGTRIYAFGKQLLYAGNSAPHTAFTRLDIGTDQVPAVTLDDSLSDLYLVSSWNGNDRGKGSVRIFKISGNVGSEVFSLGSFAEISLPWAAGPRLFADFAPQKGSTARIAVGDDAIQNVVYRNGSLWVAQTIFLPASTPTRCSVQWWQLTIAGGILQRGRIDDPTGGGFFAYPSIAVNKNSDVLIGYARFSAQEYAGGAYSFRAAGDPQSTLRAGVVLRAGLAPYSKKLGGDSNRWGDYSSTVADPLNDADFWTIQEYAAAPVGGEDRWGTWWGRIVPPVRQTPFHRGDVDGDGSLNVSDVIGIILHLFEGSTIACLKSADVDGSGALDVTDPVYVLEYLFLTGPAPASPFPACGIEAAPSPLACDAYPACG
jgi:hypothetical protein